MGRRRRSLLQRKGPAALPGDPSAAELEGPDLADAEPEPSEPDPSEPEPSEPEPVVSEVAEEAPDAEVDAAAPEATPPADAEVSPVAPPVEDPAEAEAVEAPAAAEGAPGKKNRKPTPEPPPMRFVAYREMLRGWRPPRPRKPRRRPKPLITTAELQMASSIAALAVVMMFAGTVGVVLLRYLVL
jgi:hypothetical protein